MRNPDHSNCFCLPKKWLSISHVTKKKFSKMRKGSVQLLSVSTSYYLRFPMVTFTQGEVEQHKIYR